LSVHERRELRAIEQELAASAPHLTGMLSTFSRLTAGEALPRRERIHAQRPVRRRSRATRRPHWVVRVSVVAMYLFISVALLAVAMLLGHPNDNETCARSAPPCVTHSPFRP
jgi:hypothetical protein